MAKCVRKIILPVILLSLILNVLVLAGAGCKKGPWSYDNVIWYSDDPQIEIIKELGKDWVGTLTVDDTEMQIELHWGGTWTYRIVDATKNDGNTAVEYMTLLWGRVEYKKNIVTLVIKEDYIFDYKYSSIKLIKKDIEL